MNVVHLLDECDSSGYVVSDTIDESQARKILLMPPDSPTAARNRVYKFKSKGEKTIFVGVVGNRYAGVVQGKTGGQFEVRLT